MTSNMLIMLSFKIEVLGVLRILYLFQYEENPNLSETHSQWLQCDQIPLVQFESEFCEAEY